MSIFFRKSIKAGPFRFNLSKSGIGVSVGLPGLRVGTGPRGNYVHMGGGGLFYRATLPSGVAAPSRLQRGRPVLPPAPTDGHRADWERIESGDVLAMTDESAAGLLTQIQAAERHQPMMPWALGGSLTLPLLALAAGAPGWLAIAAAAAGAAATGWTHARDIARRTVVLFYDLEPGAQAAYEELHVAFRRLVETQALWNVEAKAVTDDRKRNAGATRLLQRQRVTLGFGAPPVIRTNVDVPAIPCGRETLYFFPDRLLVTTPEGTGAVSYDQLEITVESGPFVEAEALPGDASVIDTTWQYVNRDGGPDRRFADNPELPIVLYEQLSLTSRTGLNEVLQLSKTGGGLSFRSAVESLAALARGEGQAPQTSPGAGGSHPTPAEHASVTPSTGFQGTVSGDVDCAIQGRAVYGSRDNGKGRTIFYFVLRHEGREADGEHSLVFSTALDGLPKVGRYELGEAGPRSFIAMYSHETAGGSSGSYTAMDNGFLEVEAVLESMISGRAQFRGEGSNTFNLWAVEGHVRVSVTFVAELIEGDPYELSRLPGEIRALAEVNDDDEDFLLADPEEGDLHRFAAGIVTHMVAGAVLDSVLAVFATHGMDVGRVRLAEALLFAALPFDALIRVGHFDERGPHFQDALRSALAAHIGELTGLSPMELAGLVDGRLDEYATVLFEEGALAVREDGMEELAKQAVHHMLGRATDDHALLASLFTLFGDVSQSLGYGERLADLYEAYLSAGDAIWED